MMRKTLTIDTFGWFPLNLAGGIDSIYNDLIYGNLRLLSVTSQLLKRVNQGWVRNPMLFAHLCGQIFADIEACPYCFGPQMRGELHNIVLEA